MNPNNPNDRTHFAFLDDDKLSAFGDFEVDLEEAVKNILECNGGDPDFSADLEWGGTYPPCMLYMRMQGVPDKQEELELGTQSCTATDNGIYATWSVATSADFNSDACNDVFEAVKGHGNTQAPTNWQCVEEGGRFQFWFDYAKIQGGSGDSLSAAFADVFPPNGGKYGNVNGFNCPDY